ncbi:hypothetical protein K2Z84_34405 [Candidatus Binatia bacterium]|nr:hypothetical protein [Microbacteriaceae bacterium]MBY0280455.1 hypothetical protein [Candidatus Binatia bacterium]
MTTMKGDLTGLIDSEAAAKLLGITLNHLRVRVHRGEIPVALRVGRTPLFSARKLKELKAFERADKTRNETKLGLAPNRQPKTKVAVKAAKRERK